MGRQKGVLGADRKPDGKADIQSACGADACFGGDYEIRDRSDLAIFRVLIENRPMGNAVQLELLTEVFSRRVRAWLLERVALAGVGRSKWCDKKVCS